MTRNVHEEARELIAIGNELADEHQNWLRAHLQECAACAEYSEAATQAVRALRSQPFAADSALVRMTQMRVRARAWELQRRQERVWVVMVCSVAVTLVTAFTTAVVWRGFAWMGAQADFSGPLYLLMLVLLAFGPAVGAGIVFMAQGTYFDGHNRSQSD